MVRLSDLVNFQCSKLKKSSFRENRKVNVFLHTNLKLKIKDISIYTIMDDKEFDFFFFRGKCCAGFIEKCPQDVQWLKNYWHILCGKPKNGGATWPFWSERKANQVYRTIGGSERLSAVTGCLLVVII